MNPNLPKTPKQRKPKPAARPPAAVLDVWRTARGVEAVQLLFLTSRAGCDGAVAAARAVFILISTEGKSWRLKLVADEFKVVICSFADLPLSTVEVGTAILELTRAMEAAGVERA